MGFFDLFKKKRPELPEGRTPIIESETSDHSFKEDTLSKLKVTKEIKSETFDERDYIFSESSSSNVFSEVDSETGKPILVIRRKAISNNYLDLGTIPSGAKINKENIKSILKQIDAYIDKVRIDGGLNPQRLQVLKTEAKESIEDYAKTKNVTLSPNVDKVLDIMNVQTQLILHPDSILNYRDYEAQLKKTIDVSELPFDQIVEYGEAFTSRLKVLSTIKTPDDAYLHKKSLINFMKSKEQSSLQGRILAMLPTQDSNTLSSPEDKVKSDTIMEVLEAVNENIPNEDNLMYSAFLKLEEKRIISKLQEDLKSFQIAIGNEVSDQIDDLNVDDLTPEEIQARKELILKRRVNDYRQAGTLIGVLDEEKFNPDNSSNASSEQPLQTEITAYMVSMLNQANVDNYTKNGLKNDLAIKGFIASHKDEVPNSDTALAYLTARMHSVGQVIDIPRPNSLRTFIETTDYMSPNIDQEKEFLLSVSRLEEHYIQSFYAPILKLYEKHQEKLSYGKSGYTK